MMSLEALRPLFVFEMANNHMGDVNHGIRMIREFHQVCRDFDFHFAFKLQYRELDTFIHPDFKVRSDLKFVKRFSETRLAADQLKGLVDEMKTLGFTAICTPFDEPSVDLIEAHGIDIIKVASCSFTDWPLLERIVKTVKPIIASTAGAKTEELDRVVSFFEHRCKDFALMHCVGEYPTPPDRYEINQIDFLKQRYPQTLVGYSTHEDPDDCDGVRIAVAKGAAIFEKHVGLPTDAIGLNLYSASPDQVRRWLEAVRRTLEMCGVVGKRHGFSREETASLRSLQRGVFAAGPIAKDKPIHREDVFFAIPVTEGQITANDFSKYTEFRAATDIAANAPLLRSDLDINEIQEKIYAIVDRVKLLINKSGVALPPKVELEVSHHYGIDRFDEYGLTLITVVNREYCKKLIILLPGQSHPEQYHEQKEETFHILYGDVQIGLDGKRSAYRTGDVLTVERKVRHTMHSDGGVIIEEISSTHYKDDSYYTDPAIMQNSKRKTILTYWMNH